MGILFAAARSLVTVQDEARLNAEEVAVLRQYVHKSVGSIKRALAAFRQLGRPDLPQYPAMYESLYSLLERLERGASL